MLNVKGYDGEVFVNSYGEGEYKVENMSGYSFFGVAQPPDYYYNGLNARTKTNFFTVHADNSGNPTFSKLNLNLEMNFPSNVVQLLSMVAVDIDDDGYTDDFAVLVNTDVDVRLYFYKLVYDGSKFTLKGTVIMSTSSTLRRKDMGLLHQASRHLS